MFKLELSLKPGYLIDLKTSEFTAKATGGFWYSSLYKFLVEEGTHWDWSGVHLLRDATTGEDGSYTINYFWGVVRDLRNGNKLSIENLNAWLTEDDDELGMIHKFIVSKVREMGTTAPDINKINDDLKAFFGGETAVLYPKVKELTVCKEKEKGKR